MAPIAGVSCRFLLRGWDSAFSSQCTSYSPLHLYRHWIRDSGYQELFHRPLLLERLQYLELSFNYVNVKSTWILGQVRLPSLREVSLHYPAYTHQDALPFQITNSFQSSPLLEKFTLSGMVMSDHDLIQALQNIPSVRDLSLDFLVYRPISKLLTENFLQRLYYSRHTEILLPNLRSSTYGGPTSLNEHMHLFRDVLVYRFNPRVRHAIRRSRLRTNNCSSNQVGQRDELVWICRQSGYTRSLVQAGLEFSLTRGMKWLWISNGVSVLAKVGQWSLNLTKNLQNVYVYNVNNFSAGVPYLIIQTL